MLAELRAVLKKKNLSDNKIVDLLQVKDYGLTIQGEEFNTNICLPDLINSGKYAIMDESNINDIPKAPGNYWVATDEGIAHSLNPDFDKRPKPIKIKGRKLKIIYNGQAENLRDRIKAHLYRQDSKGIGDRSGISVDITDKYTESHNKCLYQKSFTDYTKAATIDDLSAFTVKKLKDILKSKNLHISGSKTVLMERVWKILHPDQVPNNVNKIREYKKESKKKNKKKKLPYYEPEKRPIQYKDIKFISSEDDSENVIKYMNNVTEESEIYFKNGIDIREKKHKKYTWLVVYYDMNKAIYHPVSDLIEQKWRKLNGCPILCSYKCGR
jgi:hypothetical protein